MSELIFVFHGVLAMVSAIPAFMRVDDPTRAIFALFSTICWATWSLTANGVDIYRAATVYSASYRSLVFVGVAAGLIMLLFTVKAAIATIGSSNEEMIRS